VCPGKKAGALVGHIKEGRQDLIKKTGVGGEGGEWPRVWPTSGNTHNPKKTSKIIEASSFEKDERAGLGTRKVVRQRNGGAKQPGGWEGSLEVGRI